jgi:hypothetical protein
MGSQLVFLFDDCMQAQLLHALVESLHHLVMDFVRCFPVKAMRSYFCNRGKGSVPVFFVVLLDVGSEVDTTLYKSLQPSSFAHYQYIL